MVALLGSFLSKLLQLILLQIGFESDQWFSEKRNKTIKLLINAINKFSIDGIKNNLNFLSAILINKNFSKGTFSTKFLEMEYPNGFKDYQLNKNDLCKLSAAVLAIYKNYEIFTKTLKIASF